MAWINNKIWSISSKVHYPYEWIFGKASPWPEYIIKELTWNWYINLTNAVANHLMELKAYGWTEQNWTPTPTIPVAIISNNWTIKFSKNMANVNSQTALVWYYISSQWVVSADVYNRIYQDYIPVKPSTTYTLSMSSSVYYVTISEYSTAEDSGFVIRKAGSSGSNTSLTITTGANTNFVRFWTNIDRTSITMEEVLAINRQLEIWSTATPYHKYVEWWIYIDWTTETISSTLSTATAEMLLKVGDYQDVQSILDGAITRNVGVKVFDGTENWSPHATLAGWFQLAEPLTYGGIAPALCTHYPYSSTQGNAGVYFSTGRYNPQTSRIIIADNVKFPNTGMLADFKQFLADQYNAWTPVIIVYPLATPTTESVAGQTMHIPAWNSTIEITQASIDNLWLYAKYKATA